MRFAVLTVCSLFAAAAAYPLQSHAEEVDFSTAQEDYDRLVAGRDRDEEKDTLYDENRRALRREAYQQLQLQQMQECCPGYQQGYGPYDNNLYNESWKPQPYPYTYPQ